MTVWPAAGGCHEAGVSDGGAAGVSVGESVGVSVGDTVGVDVACAGAVGVGVTVGLPGLGVRVGVGGVLVGVGLCVGMTVNVAVPVRWGLATAGLDEMGAGGSRRRNGHLQLEGAHQRGHGADDDAAIPRDGHCFVVGEAVARHRELGAGRASLRTDINAHDWLG